MTCDKAKVLLHALLDGELDAGHVRHVDVHIMGCPGCAADLRQFCEVRHALVRANLRFTAPAELRSRIGAAIPAPTVR
jgi:anti-sigma factor (TIGR02949 family)